MTGVQTCALPILAVAAEGLISYSAVLKIGLPPDSFPKVRCVLRSGVGYDTIDGAAWGARGIPVFNVPDYGTSEVADHAIALMLALTRGTAAYHDAMRRDPVKHWTYTVAPTVRRLRVSTFGVVGLGRIGLAAARRAGVPVLYYVTPQVWASRPGRMKVMARVITKAAVILPFEEALLRQHGVNARFVGHPLLDRAAALPSREEARARLGLPATGEVLALFPGSRPQEIARHTRDFEIGRAHV